MKKTLIALAAFAGIAAASPASATQWGDLACSIRDTGGNALAYSFGRNTVNANGSFGGTVVENGFDKNGTSVFTQAGKRPI
jgi:hypothetical protein